MPTCGFAICRPLNRRMIYPSRPRPTCGRAWFIDHPTQPAPAEPPRSAHTVAALRRSLGCHFGQPRSERESPARDELPCPTIEPGGPSRHAEPSADQPRPGMPPDSTAGRRTLTVLTRPPGHRRRRVRNPTDPCRGPAALANEADARRGRTSPLRPSRRLPDRTGLVTVISASHWRVSSATASGGSSRRRRRQVRPMP